LCLIGVFSLSSRRGFKSRAGNDTQVVAFRARIPAKALGRRVVNSRRPTSRCPEPNYIVVNYTSDSQIKRIWILWQAHDGFFSPIRRNSNARTLNRAAAADNIEVISPLTDDGVDRHAVVIVDRQAVRAERPPARITFERLFTTVAARPASRFVAATSFALFGRVSGVESFARCHHPMSGGPKTHDTPLGKPTCLEANMNHSPRDQM
jgi:hypothetical protein